MESKQEEQELETKPTTPLEVEDEDDGVDYWKEFQLGTRAVFQKWTAIRMAVDRGWGGRASAEKEEILITSIIDLLDNKPDLDRLLDLIEGYLPDNFSVIVEDNSAEQVGEDIWEIFCTCAEGDTSFARKVFDTLPIKTQQEIFEIVGLKEPELISEPAKNIPETKPQVEVDDDGWEVVPKRKKNKKNN